MKLPGAKLVVLVLGIFLQTAHAAPITASAPIAVTGGGSFGWSNSPPRDGGWLAYVFGSNGIDTLSANVGTSSIAPFVTINTAAILLNGYGSWMLNGSGVFLGQVILSIRGDGTGHVDLTDGATGLTGSADLLGYLTITSIKYTDEETSGTFIITPTPEPSMSVLVLGGLLSTLTLRRMRPNSIT